MVMELPPSPQCVGREFVRRYYTLLNTAPPHLHRFYNKNSSFLHGGLDTREADSAVGQKEIHNRIQALNFRDCHVKIHQVDSQSTLGNGVVVQVSGELSNNGQAMRRFTQTFVLAAQAPKKYYVHNDIFRYQDFGYEEEEEDLEEHPMSEVCDREPEMDAVQEVVEEEPPQQPATKITSVELIQTQQQLPTMNQQQIFYSIQQSVLPMMQQVTLNGSVHEDSSIIAQQSPPQQNIQQSQYTSEPANQESPVQESEHESYMQQQQLPPQQQPMKADSQVSEEESNELRQQEGQQNFAPSAPEPEPEHQSQVQNINSGPKTYANLVKSYPSTGIINPQPPIQNMRIDDRQNIHQIQSQPHSTQPNVTPNQQIHRMSSGGLTQQNQQYPQRMPRSGGPIRDNERRVGRPNNYTDAHQLFLGNLPHQATETELRTLFERYGRVADLRVHSKLNDRMKGPPGTVGARVPNYGFITFEDQSVVAKVLADLPIYFPDENGQKLNVEEKKMRPREGGSGSGRPNNMKNVNIRSAPIQQQPRGEGGPPGGPGIMRGGQHGGRGRGFSRSGDGGRGVMRQSGGNAISQNYQNRR